MIKLTMMHWNGTICLVCGLMLGFVGSAYGESGELGEYFSGHKYQLKEAYRYQLSFSTGLFVAHECIVLEDDILILLEGFGWDGASGPAIDTKNALRASAVHDALGILMNRKLIERSRFKELSDDEFAIILKEEEMPAVRRWYMRKAIGLFGGAGPDDRGDLMKRTLSINASIRVSVQSAALRLEAMASQEDIEDLKDRPLKIAFPDA
jgi:hypothetical protein